MIRLHRFFLLLALLSLPFAPAEAQRLTAQEELVDAGRTGYQQPITAHFELRNRSLRRLTVTEVKPDCGCTTASLPKKELAPGERLTLTLTYDARQLGHFERSVAIFTQGTREPLYLTMQGVVLADYHDYSVSHPYSFGPLLADRQELTFDDVKRGDTLTQVIRLVNNTNEVLTPNVQHLPPYLTTQALPVQLQPGATGEIRVTLRSGLVRDFGLTQARLHLAGQLGETVRQENEMDVSVILLPEVAAAAEGQPQPRLSLSAEEVELTDFGRSGKKSAAITITNDGQRELNISSLQMFTPGLRVTLGKRVLKPGEQTRLRITAFRDELRQAHTQPRILMITDDPARPKVVIRVK